MNTEFTTLIKTLAAALGGWLMQALMPALPYTLVCTLLVVADVVSARRLAHRLRRKLPSRRQQLKFTSARFGHMLLRLAHIYALLLVTALLQYVVVPEVELLRLVSGLVCFWQIVSILENESSANDSPWARIAGKILIDKTERHLGISLDELRKLGDE